MLTIDKLIGHRGDARRLLRIPGRETITLNEQLEWKRLEILQDLHFSNFAIQDVEIRTNFVRCTFDSCRFQAIETDGHLWGASDIWRDCNFDGCTLRSIISPMNSFVACTFRNVNITNYKPYQTLFQRCSFVGGQWQGLRAHLVQNRTMSNPLLPAGAGMVCFRHCEFDSLLFEQCYFEGVVFEKCAFRNVEVQSSQFEGVTSDIRWWSAQVGTPFSLFLTKALALVATKCGKESAAYKEFEKYVIDFGVGKTGSRDFSACLYSNRVPYSDRQKLIKDLRELTRDFPF